jgi:hypothetical protein
MQNKPSSSEVDISLEIDAFGEFELKTVEQMLFPVLNKTNQFGYTCTLEKVNCFNFSNNNLRRPLQSVRGPRTI